MRKKNVQKKGGGFTRNEISHRGVTRQFWLACYFFSDHLVIKCFEPQFKLKRKLLLALQFRKLIAITW